MRIVRSTTSLLLVAFALPVQPICYYPNGDASTQDVPCNGGGDDESTCCGPGLACLSNNLCMATGVDIQSPTMKSTYVRGTCTDKSWRSGNCPSFCIDDEFNRLDQGAPVESCPAKDDDDDGTDGGSEELYYCVNKQKTDCEKRKHVLIFEGPASTITTIGVAPSTTSTSTGTSESESTSTRASATGSQAEAPTEESSRDTAGTSERGSESGGSNSSSGLSHGATIGIGVGVGVGGGLALVAAVAFFLLLRRRRRASSEPPKELSARESPQELIGDEPTRKVEMDSSQSPASELEAPRSHGHYS